MPVWYLSSLMVFQPTPSCRGRRGCVLEPPMGKDFNPRPRAEGGPVRCPGRAPELFQPTPSCRGRHHSPFDLTLAHPISTHALVQRAAAAQRFPAPSSPISTHALVQRAAAPRHLFGLYRVISTHALVQRAAALTLTN